IRAAGAPPLEVLACPPAPPPTPGPPRRAVRLPPAPPPRRTVLDKILVDAAVRSGAELRERFSVDEFLLDDGAVVGIRGHDPAGSPIVERARVVIGADGRHSQLARTVGARQYADRPKSQWAYYTYFRDLPVDGFEIYISPYR